MDRITIKVEGMSCGHCEARVEKAVKTLRGVETAKADHKKNELVVECDPNAVSAAQIVAAVIDAGYKASQRP